MTTCAC